MLEFDTGEKRLFEFAVDGEQFAIPTFDSFSASEALKIAREFKSGDELDADKLNTFITELFEKHAPGVVSRISLAQFKTLADAYFEASAVDVGE